MIGRWGDQGIMRRKQAIKFAHWWALRGHSVRIEPLQHGDHVRVYLKIRRHA